MNEPTIDQIRDHIQGWRVSKVEWCGEGDDDGIRISFDECREGCMTTFGHQALEVISAATWQEQGYLRVKLG